MAKQDRLRPLQMGVTRHVGVADLDCSRQEHLLERQHVGGDLRSGRLHHRRNAVATWSLRLRPVCSLAPVSPGHLGDASLDRGVDVFVGVDEDEGAVGEFAADLIERGEQCVALLLGEQRCRGPGLVTWAFDATTSSARGAGRTAG